MSTIKERISKLLTLSNSPNENEAMAAMAKAKALLEEHQLEMSDIENITVEIEICEEIISATSEANKTHGGILIFGLAQYYDFYAYYSGGKGIKVVGPSTNVYIGVHMYNYLMATMERELKAQRKVAKLNGFYDKDFGPSFRQAFVGRLQRRLVEMTEASKPATGEPALIFIDRTKAAIADYLKAQGFKSKGAGNLSSRGGSGTAAGASAGDRVNLNKQLRPKQFALGGGK